MMRLCKLINFWQAGGAPKRVRGKNHWIVSFLAVAIPSIVGN